MKQNKKLDLIDKISQQQQVYDLYAKLNIIGKYPAFKFKYFLNKQDVCN